jgi:hypothetical protein
MGRALKRAGIATHVTVHGLRRTLNTLALQVAPGELVRKILGHADQAMTLHYLAPDIEARRQLSASVFGLVEGTWSGLPGSNRRPTAWEYVQRVFDNRQIRIVTGTYRFRVSPAALARHRAFDPIQWTV